MSYKQLELVYEKLYAISLEIKKQIEEKDYNEILSTINKKDMLINQLNQTKKILTNQSEVPDFIKEMESKLNQQELDNMEKLEKARNELKNELNKLNKDIKLVSAYSQNDGASSIIDITE